MLEGGGKKLYDVSGFDNHSADISSTNMDPATDWVPSLYGHALEFDGVNQYVAIGEIEEPANVTVLAWVRPGRTTNDESYVDYRQTGANSHGWVLQHVNNAGVRFLIYSGGGFRLTPVYALTANTWYFLVGTYDGSTLRLYVDGVQRQIFSWSGSVSYHADCVATIGARQDGANEFFQGAMAGALVYNRALARSEIQQHYVDPDAMLRPRREVFPTAVVAPTDGVARMMFLSGAI
jgi:hypothetical protein